MLIWQAPWWLAAVPLALATFALAARHQPASASLLTLIHPLLHAESAAAPRRFNVTPWVLALIAVALAQPAWRGDWLKPPPEGRELVLVVDASKSMSIGDFTVAGQPVERLTVLKGLITRFVERRLGDRFGLVIFGDHAATLLSPTADHALVNAMLNRIPVGISGENTALGDAIALALTSTKQNTARRPALLVFTDGDSTAGIVTTREAAALARERSTPVYTVKVGTDLFGHAKRNHADFGLAEIAAATGARFYTASSANGLDNVIEDIGTLERVPVPASRVRETRALYWIPLGVALLLLLGVRILALRRAAT